LVHFSRERLQEITSQATDKEILVLGDLMVDEYLWGEVTRISPEAPVPIVNIESAQFRFGGAANVAYNLLGLKAKPVLFGTVGNDRMGEIFIQMLQENGLSTEGIVQSSDRPTTLKTRIIGNNQHIARVDRESTKPIPSEIQKEIFHRLEQKINDVSAIILQDYNKGVIVPELVERIIQLANKKNKFVTVDPKFNNFFSFKKVTVFKPNTKETEEALAVRIYSDENIQQAGQKLLKALDCQAVLITRGSKGMALFTADGESVFIGTRARKVADVSGAGDTVIATLTYALCGGANMKEAVTLANFAAGWVCGEVGVVPVERDHLIEWILKHQDDFDD